MLSVNLNKAALLRNARGYGGFPDLKKLALIAISAGCRGLTVHPRSDCRHITLSDVRMLSELKDVKDGKIELNVEGDCRDELVDVVRACKVSQFTLVPVHEGEKTTERGWCHPEDGVAVLRLHEILESVGVRLSLFIDPREDMVSFAHANGFGAVEFHTRRYAELFEKRDMSGCAEELDRISSCALIASSLGMRVNLGHDLNMHNLPMIIGRVKPDEVSIGQAIISDAIERGLELILPSYQALVENNN